jgi:hypothetical protein
MEEGGLERVIGRESDVDSELATCVGWISGSFDYGHPARRLSGFGYLKRSFSSTSSTMKPVGGLVLISCSSYPIRLKDMGQGINFLFFYNMTLEHTLLSLNEHKFYFFSCKLSKWNYSNEG